jgi:preprotein translocase subunit SecE
MSQKTVTVRNPAKRVRFRFLRGAFSELRKVVWLSRRELLYLTGLVLVVVVVFGVVLGLIDFGFTELVNGVFIGR